MSNSGIRSSPQAVVITRSSEPIIYFYKRHRLPEEVDKPYPMARDGLLLDDHVVNALNRVVSADGLT